MALAIAAYAAGVASGLYVTECARCGVEFAITGDYEKRRREDKKTFHCPNGHIQYFPGKTPDEREIEELKSQLASETSARKWAETRAKGAAVKAGKAKAEKARLERRVNCGVCPHCSRTFRQLAAHMKTKHSGMVKS